MNSVCLQVKWVAIQSFKEEYGEEYSTRSRQLENEATFPSH